MSVGNKIKEYRLKSGLTQKDLSEQLHVTYQAVSKWENESSEPSLDMIKKISQVLNCSIDDLFEVEKNEEVQPIVEQQTEEEISCQEKEEQPKKVIAVCDWCGRSIVEGEQVYQVDVVKDTYYKGNKKIIEQSKKNYCKDCNEIHLMTTKQEKEREKIVKDAKFKSKRIISFIAGGIFAVLSIIFSIMCFVQGFNESGIGWIIIGLFGYTFISTMILNNTFLPELWLEIVTWGFVDMPGIIFTADLDGVIFLIVMKIFFFFLSIIIALLVAAFATVLSIILSVFVYPFALCKNLKGKE